VGSEMCIRDRLSIIQKIALLKAAIITPGRVIKGKPFSLLGYPALEVCCLFYVFAPSISSH
ncbi:hypothetical protein QG055_10010, partial [Kingella kingae]|uniref:hypothetical protein n=1 Tax=Kingella kingae TaxID=504 RepID=UPI0025534EA8